MKLAPFSIFLSTQFIYVLCTNKRCRCLSTDSCWPSQSAFASLQANLSQPLLNQILPPASPCYPISSPSGNCSQVREGYMDGIWRATIPGSMQAPNWETYEHGNTIDTCYLNATSESETCMQGSIPTVGVDARVPEDIIAAVGFARTWGLRVVVKSTGHDYLGRSTARGAFLIWMHNMKEMTYNESFVPEGAPASENYKAVTIGSGVNWREAYEFIHTHNRTLVGGACDTVGAAGGWVLGGGHSPLSAQYGLGVDQAIQFTVVTSSGAYLTASAHSHPSLFWALRGGGGGTYGIITSVTYKTHPEFPLTANLFIASVAPGSQDGYKKLMMEFIKMNPQLSDDGWTEYGLWDGASFLLFGLGPNISQEMANATWDQFYAFARSLAGEGIQVQADMAIAFGSWYEWYKRLVPVQTVGASVELGSRLLSRDLVEGSYERVVEIFVERNMSVTWALVGGGAVSKVDPESTGLNPFWRSAIVLANFGENWSEGASLDEIRSKRYRIRENIKALEALAPGSGTYFNEASLYEENPKQTFFGSHYDRLKEIKDEYDPQGLFVVAEGVGSDEWDASLNCRL